MPSCELEADVEAIFWLEWLAGVSYTAKDNGPNSPFLLKCRRPRKSP